MSLSNRERVGRGLDLLGHGLEPVVASALAERVPRGKDWTVFLAARDAERDSKKGVANPKRVYDRSDVQLQLRALTEMLQPGWRPFSGVLSRPEESLASELRDTRNRWAHNTPFSTDDAYRALDTTERLLRAVGAVDEANGVKAIRVDLQRTEFRDEVTRETRARTSLAGMDSPDLPTWRKVLRPHADIESGNFAASEFAADLHEVAAGTAESEYGDPAEFFRRTYLTDGLRELLTRAVDRIEGDRNADPVVNLQTNFGGGKTHSMLAAWHLFGGIDRVDLPQEYAEIVGARDSAAWGSTVRRAAVVGTQLSAGQATIKPDGTQVHTLWGELAWQLGGPEAYARIAASDRVATNPGEHLKALVADMAPCVILIDEWVAYARDLYARDDLPGGTFDTQFTFAQSLTEAVRATPGALLLVSIPASDVRLGGGESESSALEIGGAHGRHALERLQNVVSRTAYEWRAASAQESFEIVRRRLFRTPDGDTAVRIAAVAKGFSAFYQSHSREFPRETSDPAYAKRIQAAYPIHPELFDRLYSDWGALPRFQRTRGVLRLMSAVVHSLDKADDPSPLIMPGSVPLDALGVRDEVAKYLDDNWKPIVETDVDGEGATPLRIDEERPLLRKRRLTQRIARALFLGSAATLHSAHRGMERKQLFLGVAQPGDTVGNFGSALQMLSDRATYLYSESDRYWYDTQPSLNRKVAEQAESLTEDDVWAEIVRRLQAERSTPGDFADVQIAPTGTAAVPEATASTLVVLHPRHLHSARSGAHSGAREFAGRLFTERGTSPRERRNMLVAVAPDMARADDLDSAVRHYLAWQWIEKNMAELDLTDSNKTTVRRRLSESNATVQARIGETYIWALYPYQSDGSRPAGIEVEKLDSTVPGLAVRASKKLRSSDQLVGELGAPTLRLALDGPLEAEWRKGSVEVGTLWSWFQKYPYLLRLRNRQVLDDAVQASLSEFTWEKSGFALATGVAENGDFEGLVAPGGDAVFGPVLDTTRLVQPMMANAQIARMQAASKPEARPADDTPGGPVGHPGDGPTTTTGTGAPPPHEREPIRNAIYDARVEVDPGKDITSYLSTLGRELLTPLRDGADAIEVTVRVRAENMSGFDDRTVRIVRENGGHLGVVDGRFEDL